MKLTVIAPENVYEHDVDPSIEIRDLLALLEAETGVPTHLQTLTTDSGEPMTAPERGLQSYGLQGESATIFVTFQQEPQASTSYAPAQSSSELDDDIERMRLQALGDPRVMAQLRQANPAFAQAIESGGPAFRQMMVQQQQAQRQTMVEKERQIALLNADPYDVEAQKKIEEAIRMEAVLENMHHAMEYSPESFGHVTMLYINVEVNGHPVKAFVDSGAQTTIKCAEACGIMRLLDKRFAGVAQGVGTANILGRIHSAQIKLGGLYLPVAFSVLEGRSVELLFGLDMLKRHQACIDLASNVLRIGTAEIAFLPEHELPEFARRKDAEDVADEMGQAAATGVPVSPKAATRGFPGAGQALGAAGPASAGPSGTSGAGPSSGGPSGGAGGSAQAGAAGGFKQDDVDALVNLGASPDHAVELLRAAGGNVDVAASMLFG